MKPLKTIAVASLLCPTLLTGCALSYPDMETIPKHTVFESQLLSDRPMPQTVNGIDTKEPGTFDYPNDGEISWSAVYGEIEQENPASQWIDTRNGCTVQEKATRMNAEGYAEYGNAYVEWFVGRDDWIYWWTIQIENYYRQYNAPLADCAQVIATECWYNEIDPRIPVVIMLMESGGGAATFNGYNCAGWMTDTYYSSYEDFIINWLPAFKARYGGVLDTNEQYMYIGYDNPNYVATFWAEFDSIPTRNSYGETYGFYGANRRF